MPQMFVTKSNAKASQQSIRRKNVRLKEEMDIWWFWGTRSPEQFWKWNLNFYCMNVYKLTSEECGWLELRWADVSDHYYFDECDIRTKYFVRSPGGNLESCAVSSSTFYSSFTVCIAQYHRHSTILCQWLSTLQNAFCRPTLSACPQLYNLIHAPHFSHLLIYLSVPIWLLYQVNISKNSYSNL